MDEWTKKGILEQLAINVHDLVTTVHDDVWARLDELVTSNVAWLREHPETPWLYESGVRYRKKIHDAPWEGIGRLLQCGEADGPELVAWRIAELREREMESASVPFIEVTSILPAPADPDWDALQIGATVYVAVQRIDGYIEHPSRLAAHDLEACADSARVPIFN
ncbi:hypothetical protein [Pendulispora albinea]|uniref:Uncharacterized protein n=1 Tax=Pendulispora albinea TaxID=2741071 RepID=A0ABZ2M4M0_9BACT